MSLSTRQRIYQKLKRTILHPVLDNRRKNLGIDFLEPNYLFFNNLTSSSVVVDVGCGHVAEFSRSMISRYNLTAYGVDPTKKHSVHLEKLEKESQGNFVYLPYAVTKQNGLMKFYESVENESGSTLSQHNNVVSFATSEYEVESVNLQTLAQKTGKPTIDFLKLDLEGAEYELLHHVTEKELAPFKQIFVEFHHHCTHYSVKQTDAIVKHIEQLGFNSVTIDFRNYLIYRE